MRMPFTLLSLLQVELYMAELYNKIGTGLITWSPISLGLCSGKQEELADGCVVMHAVPYKTHAPHHATFKESC